MQWIFHSKLLNLFIFSSKKLCKCLTLTESYWFLYELCQEFSLSFLKTSFREHSRMMCIIWSGGYHEAISPGTLIEACSKLLENVNSKTPSTPPNFTEFHSFLILRAALIYEIFMLITNNAIRWLKLYKIFRIRWYFKVN